MSKLNERLARLYNGRSEEIPARSVKVGDLAITTRRFGLEAVASRVIEVRRVKARINGRWTHAVEITCETEVSNFPVILKRAAKTGKVLVARM